MKRLVLTFLLLLTLPCAADGVGTIRAALKSGQPFVLIGVPKAFVDGTGGGETQNDWGFYLSRWQAGAGKQVRTVIVPISAYRAAIKAPMPKENCVTVFVRRNRDAFAYLDSCVFGEEAYEEGAKWMRGEGALSEGSQIVKLVPR